MQRKNISNNIQLRWNWFYFYLLERTPFNAYFQPTQDFRMYFFGIIPIVYKNDWKSKNNHVIAEFFLFGIRVYWRESETISWRHIDNRIVWS